MKMLFVSLFLIYLGAAIGGLIDVRYPTEQANVSKQECFSPPYLFNEIKNNNTTIIFGAGAGLVLAVIIFGRSDQISDAIFFFDLDD